MFNRIADYLPRSLGGKAATQSPPASAGAFGNMSLKSVLEPVEQAVKQYPGVALATAFLAGVAVAWWIKRR